MMNMKRIGARTCALLAAVAATASLAAVPARAQDSSIVALVASNAQGAFSELIKQFEAEHKGVKVEASYLGGSAIGKAVDEGKAVDVVLVGSSILEKESQLVDAPVPVLRNRETILVPLDNPAKITSLRDLAKPGVKISMGTPDSAVGKLASQVIQKAVPDLGFDFVQGLRKNVVVTSDKGSDVVAAVGKDANAAIAFASDANPAKYRSIEIEDKYNVVSTYMMSVPKSSKNAQLAHDLVTLVSGPKGQATLRKFGYMPPK